MISTGPTLIMSIILLAVRPQNLQNYIKTNAAGSSKATVTDSWIAYLSANGGTGKTISDLEQSFLTAQAIGAGTLHDRWNAYLAAQPGKNAHEKARSLFKWLANAPYINKLCGLMAWKVSITLVANLVWVYMDGVSPLEGEEPIKSSRALAFIYRAYHHEEDCPADSLFLLSNDPSRPGCNHPN